MKGQTNAFARSRAKELRLDGTDCERLLWRRLRSEQLGVKFRRQHPFDRFIVDFVCLERRLIVELDGGQHQEAASSISVEQNISPRPAFESFVFGITTSLEQSMWFSK